MGYDVTRQGLGWTLFFFALLLLLFWKHSLAEPVPFDPLSAGDMPLGTVLAGVARRLPVFREFCRPYWRSQEESCSRASSRGT